MAFILVCSCSYIYSDTLLWYHELKDQPCYFFFGDSLVVIVSFLVCFCFSCTSSYGENLNKILPFQFFFFLHGFGYFKNSLKNFKFNIFQHFVFYGMNDYVKMMVANTLIILKRIMINSVSCVLVKYTKIEIKYI
jgi:hypothetical protein